MAVSMGLGAVACQSPPTQETQPQITLKEDSPLAFALLPMAWDGEKFWQLVQEEDVQGLLLQYPNQSEARNIPLRTSLPRHRSLSFAQGQLWALDRKNTIYAISPEGELLKTLKPEFPAFSNADQLVWLDDELWVLHGDYLSAEEVHEYPRFYRLDPESGEILETLVVKSRDFEGFSHQNLAARDGAFYVVQSNQFAPSKNRVYRISRQSAEIQIVELSRVYSGVQTLFFEQDRLYGIELQEQSLDCGFRCQGQLQILPVPEAPGP